VIPLKDLAEGSNLNALHGRSMFARQGQAVGLHFCATSTETHDQTKSQPILEDDAGYLDRRGLGRGRALASIGAVNL
jgi:hypothetical protein